jgi:hypothetical protein
LGIDGTGRQKSRLVPSLAWGSPRKIENNEFYRPKQITIVSWWEYQCISDNERSSRWSLKLPPLLKKLCVYLCSSRWCVIWVSRKLTDTWWQLPRKL